MTKTNFNEILETVLEDSGSGILATVGADRKPVMRWMTPTTVRDRPGVLFAVTSSKFTKSLHLKENPDVQWMIQTKALTKVINIDGRINLIENPMLKAEIMEVIGPKLRVFWKVNQNPEDLIVLETIITKASIFTPMKALRETLEFTGAGK